MKIKKLTKPDDLEDARTKYSSVISLKNSEGEIQWNRYNAMLVANTIFIGLIGFIYNNDFNFPILIKFIFGITPLFGLILCYSWCQTTERGFIWSQYWMKKANEIEGQIDGLINPIKDGEKLRDVIGFGITRKASLRIIYIFALIYILMFLNNILSVFPIKSFLLFCR